MLTRWNYAPLYDATTPVRWARAVPRRDPASWGALSDLRREMDRLLADFDRGWLQDDRAGLELPRFDVEDAGDALLVRVEVPGFAEEDLHVDLNQRTLTVRGDRRSEVPEGYSVHRRERGALSFTRTFALPCRVEASRVSASLEDGVLQISLPKAAEEQPRQIQIGSRN